MKKITLNYLLIAVFAILTLFTSCNKDKDDNNNGSGNGNGSGNSFVIDIKNVLGDYSEIATVKATYIPIVGEEYGEIAASELKNGECKLILPNTIPNDFFGHGMWSHLPRLEFSSDKGARLNSIFIFGYDKAGDRIADFFYYDYNNDRDCEAFYVYANKDFTVKGDDDEDRIIYNCTFKNGWNLIYKIEDLITTEKPSDINFKWYCAD